MAVLGAHMSIVGGHDQAVLAARRCGCDCVQLFTKSNTQWRAAKISAEQAGRFQAALAEQGVSHPLAHSSYLINLASPQPELWRKSLDALVVELRRADRLGIPFVVVHPGAHRSAGEAAGLKNIVRALNQALRRTRGIQTGCLLETTAGQGTQLGWRFEHLAALLDGLKEPDRVGVCLDTCHVFAAGYPLSSLQDYGATMRRFQKIVGLEKIKAIHLNDSKRPLGSRIDRHEHIGEGRIGLAAFRRLLEDRRFQKTPMYLETPKGARRGIDWDAINLRTLRRLARNGGRRGRDA